MLSPSGDYRDPIPLTIAEPIVGCTILVLCWIVSLAYSLPSLLSAMLLVVVVSSLLVPYPLPLLPEQIDVLVDL